MALENIESDIKRCSRNLVGDAFHRTATRCADKVAIKFKERSWTYGELNAATNRLAQALLAKGFEKGDRLAVYSRNSDTYLMFMLACYKSGIIVVPINYGLSGEELRYILDQSGTRALFQDQAGAANVAEILPRLALECLGSLDGSEGDMDVLSIVLDKASEDPGLPEVDIEGDELAQLIYTSGTTSLPKGVMLSHDAILRDHQNIHYYYGYSEDTRSICAQPFYHAVVHINSLPLLMAGGMQVVLESPVPETLLELIEKEKINSLFSPPTVWIKLLRHSDFDRRNLSSLKSIEYGASIMPEATVKELAERLPGAGLTNTYGQTEIGPFATVLLPHEHADRPTSAGRPIFGTETKIFDENMNEVPRGERGEIVHRSPQLLQGYWQKPEETAQAFEGGWFHSGDMGYMDEEGYIYVVDRIKDVINTGGVLVSSREVEECLFRHRAIADAAVIGLSHPKWVEAIIAVVVLKSGHDASEEELIAYCREHLAHFKRPQRILFTDVLPTNPSGKVLKRELRITHAELFSEEEVSL